MKLDSFVWLSVIRLAEDGIREMEAGMTVMNEREAIR